MPNAALDPAHFRELQRSAIGIPYPVADIYERPGCQREISRFPGRKNNINLPIPRVCFGVVRLISCEFGKQVYYVAETAIDDAMKREGARRIYGPPGAPRTRSGSRGI